MIFDIFNKIIFLKEMLTFFLKEMQRKNVRRKKMQFFSAGPKISPEVVLDLGIDFLKVREPSETE